MKATARNIERISGISQALTFFETVMPFTDTQADPIITANILAAGRLHEVISCLVLPFHAASKRLFPGTFHMWVRRSLANGEHLKIRIHGNMRDYDDLKRLLCSHAELFFHESVPSGQNYSEVTVQTHEPDLEEEMIPPPCDSKLVWTNYRRAPISLPTHPWIQDDAFVRQFCFCLAQGMDLLLERVAAATASEQTVSQDSLLAEALVHALARMWPCDSSETSEYLVYHRDWLVRFFVKNELKQRDMLERFEQMAQRTPSTVQYLAETFERNWQQPLSCGSGMNFWATHLNDLALYCKMFQHRLEYRIDPFTSHVIFPPLFKVFHGFANQFGLHPLQEAYVHHLLSKSIDYRHDSDCHVLVDSE